MMEPNKSAPVNEGDILAGKYKVERVLGVGGMGVVVAARHMQLDQRVALKFLLPHSLLKSTVVARFEREARAAVRLRSEHVARVIDVGTMESTAPYIVMEFLEGKDLGDLIEQGGPLPVQVAVDYLLQACEAVAEAHSLGIVHRDLKPRNLFVTTRVDGRPLVKVLDFGISKVTGGDDLSLTSTAEIVGSPNYMSPEQLRAARLADARSDIWALGAILYELLTGYVPFQAETLTQLCTMVLQDPPRPLHDLRADVPVGVINVIERCLEKDPDRRFQHVGELAQALSPFTSSSGSSAAERAMAVAGASGRSLSLRAESSSARIAVAGGGGTSVSWGNTQLAPPKSSAKLLMVLGGVALITIPLVVLAAYAVLHRTHSTAAPVTRTSASAVVSAASSVPDPIAPIASTAVVAPSAVTVDTAPTVSARPATTATVKPIKPVKPVVKPPGDDLPNVRN
ncbi:MAG: serine/threonine protein kinase [Myxococcaceae bacterium]|nr:serine/threonine protein kinase [Myxococcaceae bacterium]